MQRAWDGPRKTRLGHREGILRSDGTVARLPAESRVATEIIQSLVLERVAAWAERAGHPFAANESFGRGHPDADLSLNGGLIAVEAKSARAVKGDRTSTMTLGTYNGYFLEPDSKILRRGTRCCNDYKEHWIMAVVYKRDPAGQLSTRWT